MSKTGIKHSLIWLLLLILAFHFEKTTGWTWDGVSLKKYSVLSIPVSNPVDLTELPQGKTFQVKDRHFILQFFFDGRDIYGVILKRDPNRGIHMRWCFFRSCEDSPYNFKSVIAQAYQPPFQSGFFSIRFPANLQYQFQALWFTAPP